MSRNEIKLDQIQQRLGSGNKPRNTYYDDDGYSVSQPRAAYEPEDEGATLSAGFIATIAAVSISVGMGTYFFIGGGGSMPSFDLSFGFGGGGGISAVAGSVLDPVCGKDWKAEHPNTDQMHCYLTKQVYRLCGKDEHDALLATIRQYDKDYKVWHRKFMMASFKSIGKMQTQGLQLGLEAAKLERMEGDDAAKMEQLGKVTGIADNIMQPTNDMLAKSRNTVPMYELENAAYSLAKKGYISAADFGSSQPDFIEKALKRAGKVKTACPNRG
jgi:hypothetical protein